MSSLPSSSESLQPTNKYIIKVGNIGYYKLDPRSKAQTVVSTIASCSKFECYKEAKQLIAQFSLNLAIQRRGIQLNLLKYEDRVA